MAEKEDEKKREKKNNITNNETEQKGDELKIERETARNNKHAGAVATKDKHGRNESRH